MKLDNGTICSHHSKYDSLDNGSLRCNVGVKSIFMGPSIFLWAPADIF